MAYNKAERSDAPAREEAACAEERKSAYSVEKTM